ncbi:ABC transporter substrate-binding protein [Paenibacillus sp. JDR-2]|uniref:ABC transporter substrate-binding protein n=1 Tax=Paenibacillus sp. (strain JDR-2) TaxID=324057 RepID=UPI0001666D19|nr:ABC transporter substrate-binding protein [Paenibacillus sp. JDR-2]ACT01216.1 extracellular solute-binding protein family 1 [Paenibacillus sp. JDR-2]
MVNKKARSTRSMFLMLALVLITTMLAACSGGNEKTKNSASTTTPGNASSNAGETAKPEDNGIDISKPVTLKWYMMTFGEIPPNQDRILAAINKYTQEKLNATIDMEYIDVGSWDTKVNAMLTTREEFDMIFAPSWRWFRSNAQKGAYYEITPDALDKYLPQTKALFTDAIWDSTKVKGKYYAVPGNKDIAEAWGWVWRKDIADKYGIDMTKVKTFQDIEPILAKIKEVEPDLVPIDENQEPLRGRTTFETLNAGNWTLRTDNDSMELVKLYDQPEALEMRKLWYDFYKKGFIRKDAATKRDVDLINTGKVFASWMQLKPGKDAELNAAAKGNPAFPKDAVYAQNIVTEPYITNDAALGSSTAISSTSKNPERAMMFLELYMNDKYLNNLINFGEEGVDYTKVGDNRIEPIEGKYSLKGMNWAYGNQFLNYLQPGEADDKWEQFKTFNSSAIPVKNLGFFFDEEPVRKELNALTAATSEFAAMYWGLLDPDVYLPKLEKKEKAAGMDKVNAEVQRQWAEFLASKGK